METFSYFFFRSEDVNKVAKVAKSVFKEMYDINFKDLSRTLRVVSSKAQGKVAIKEMNVHIC